jgi:hypothetical protein
MIRRSVERIEGAPGATIALIGVACALAYGASLVFFPKPNGRIVVGDAVHYYVYLRSLVFDGDLQFHNEYVRLYGLTHRGPEVAWVYDPLPSGYIRNVMPIGTAIAWAPLYLLTAGVLSLLRMGGIDVAVDGYGRVFQAAAGFSGIAAATAGAWLAYRAAAAMFGVRPAIWATAAIWLGASPLYYSMVSPTYSHAVSMLANGAVIVYWLETRARTDLRRFAILGALIGCATLVRWQEATLLALPIVDALRPAGHNERRDRRRCGGSGLRPVVAVLAALAVFTPQMIVWNLFYGESFVIPQGGQFMRWHDAALGAVLFSDWHGLFTWTPIVALSVIGVVPLWRRNPNVAIGAIALLLAAWYTNAAVADWWAGEAFGSRRFVSCVPLFVLGLAAFFSTCRRHTIVVGVATLAIALNCLLLFQYQLFLKGWRDVAPYPRGVYGLGIARFVVPLRVVVHLLRG